MIVHFIASKSSITEQIERYRRITEVIQSKDHTLAWDWVDKIHEDVSSKTLGQNDSWSSIDEQNLVAIAKSDVIIAEVTDASFFVGYQVAQAVFQKKPLLLLQYGKSPLSVAGLSTPKGFVSSVNYEEDDLEETVSAFLTENTIDVKDMRFNFFIDRPIYNYLRWTSLKTGKTKAEILRELVEKEIERSNT